MDFSSVQVVRPYEQIVKQIQHAIRDGQIAPGERLPTERELADQFGVSRSVVREAIKVLGTMGLVESRQGSGSYVQNSTIKTISRAFVLSVSPDAESVEKLFEFRQVLETEAARLAAIRATPEQIQAIEETLARMNQRENLDAWHLFAEVDTPFHILISEACGNPYLQVAIASVRDMQQDIVRIFSERAGSVEEAMKHHHQIVEAIRHRAPDDAAASMANHIQYTASVVQRHIPREDRT
jgi:GntR family transcriptional repressor for pyruvate dehydrogenase complex